MVMVGTQEHSWLRHMGSIPNEVTVLGCGGFLGFPEWFLLNSKWGCVCVVHMLVIFDEVVYVESFQCVHEWAFLFDI
jgi:hypothetical protein